MNIKRFISDIFTKDVFEVSIIVAYVNENTFIDNSMLLFIVSMFIIFFCLLKQTLFYRFLLFLYIIYTSALNNNLSLGVAIIVILSVIDIFYKTIKI